MGNIEGTNSSKIYVCVYILKGLTLRRSMFVHIYITSLSLAGISGRLNRVRHNSCKSSATHSYQVCAVFSCVQTIPCLLPMLVIFNVCIDVNYACDWTLGLYGHRKSSCTKSWLKEQCPLPNRHSSRVSNAPGFLVGSSTNCAIPTPFFSHFFCSLAFLPANPLWIDSMLTLGVELTIRGLKNKQNCFVAPRFSRFCNSVRSFPGQSKRKTNSNNNNHISNRCCCCCSCCCTVP